MVIINKPEDLIDVQCYQCGLIMRVHPMTNMHSEAGESRLGRTDCVVPFKSFARAIIAQQ